MTRMTPHFSFICVWPATILLFVIAPFAMAEDWSPYTGEARLHSLLNDSRFRVELREGVIGTAEIRSDGTATLHAWGAYFERTWRIEEGRQVCFTGDRDTRCFTITEDTEDNNRFTARNVANQKAFLFTRQADGSGDLVIQPSADETVAAPSADDIARELANPNTAMGSLNFQIDSTFYDGDLPGADDARGTQLLFQPALPYPLSKTTNLFFRPAIPLVFERDVPAADGDFDSVEMELGDISFDASYGQTHAGGIITLLGWRVRCRLRPMTRWAVTNGFLAPKRRLP